MGRKAKLSKETKLEIVNRYKAGESSSMLADIYDIDGHTIVRWFKVHESIGPSSFKHRKENKAYSKTLKETAINAYLSGEGSLGDISIKYKISSPEMLRKWIIKYNSHIETTDYDPKPEVYMTKSRKTTYEERIEAIDFCMKNNMNYKAAAIKYGVNYAQVYTWVQKYKAQGEEGLLDRRGKNKLESKMTEEEKLRHHLKKLKAKNAYLEMENKTLKKLEEIERQVIREKHKK